MPSESTPAPRPGWQVPAAIITAAVVLITIVVAMTISSAKSEEAATGSNGVTRVQEPGQSGLTSAERRDPDDLLAVGPVDAPVVLIVFSDYQCPFCAKWSTDTLPVMMEHVEAGDLRIEWRDVNVFGPASERASRASYAAALQGKFWEYHDGLFAGGQPRPEAQLSDEALIALAGDLGLDTAQFAADLAAPETASQIAENAKLGLDLGAYSTPVFILGGTPIVGAQPTDVFSSTFDAALSATK